MTRRHPLTVNGWARRCDDCLPDEAMVKLIACEEITGGYQIWTVRAPGCRETRLLAGFLESVPSEFAP